MLYDRKCVDFSYFRLLLWAIRLLSSRLRRAFIPSEYILIRRCWCKCAEIASCALSAYWMIEFVQYRNAGQSHRLNKNLMYFSDRCQTLLSLALAQAQKELPFETVKAIQRWFLFDNIMDATCCLAGGQNTCLDSSEFVSVHSVCWLPLQWFCKLTW